MGTEPEYFDSCIDGELKTYTAWANGEVYGFILRDKEGNEIDSCWWMYSLDEIHEQIDGFDPSWKDEDISQYIV